MFIKQPKEYSNATSNYLKILKKNTKQSPSERKQNVLFAL